MATLTIKNLPDELYAALTRRAKQHRRSINNEAIVQLERSLSVSELDTEKTLEDIRKLRESIGEIHLTDEFLDHAKNLGRP
jgi:plasmid stability protein